MPLRHSMLSIILAAVVFPTPGSAQEHGFFAGLDASSGMAYGSSNTRDGGAAFAGGGSVDHVGFKNTVGMGGYVGYQVRPSLSLFLSYQRARGDIRWKATFPAVGAASRFSGSAITNAAMANMGYDLALTSTTTLRATAGLGLAFNSLSDVVETDEPTSLFLSDVANHTRTNPAAQLGIGLRYALARNLDIGLDASAAYVGGFQTGHTRSGNLGITGITPYKIDKVWRTSLGASLEFRF